MAVLCSPFGPKPQFELSDGTPAVGNKLFFYVAGSVNTKQNTYTSSTGLVANTNPIILNALGQPTNVEIWFTAGQTYKVVYAPSTDTDPPTSPIWTIDNLAGINDTTTTLDQWIAGPTPTFVSATSFTLVGDQTTNYHVGRRLKTTNSGGTIYSEITASSFAAVTTVTVANDSGVLDAGLSAGSYSVVTANNPSIDADMINRKGTAVVSAATTNIWAIAGDYVHVTGATGPITSFGTAPFAGAQRIVIFDSTPTITHNATTLQIQGGANIVADAGARAIVRADTTANMIVVDFIRNSGVPVVGTQTANTVFAGPSSGAAAVPTFRALTGADGASRVFLSKKTLTGASIEFLPADMDWTAYDYYEFVIYRAVPATNGASIDATLSENGGSSYLAGTNYNSYIRLVSETGVDLSLSQNGTAQFRIAELATVGISNSATNNGYNGRITIWGPSSTVRKQMSLSDVAFFPGSTYDSAGGNGQSMVISTAAVTGIKFALTSGNWTSGTIVAYGHRTA